ncbi:unnamed protein product [Cylicocyclus nassatus]|uniref:Uncharacterized protein n=1 Tax=Cylicocyclus nassatus TaxID=53992 RepID=A0AA36GGY2_CYLNA|nr:unnamed protein product [Cylicocyclus nassatus]
MACRRRRKVDIIQGKFGLGFLEFRLAKWTTAICQQFNYKNDVLIERRSSFRLSFFRKRIVEDSEIMQDDDAKRPEPG